MPIMSEKGLDITPGNYAGRLSNPRTESYPVTKTKRGKEVTEDAVYLKVDVTTNGHESILEASWPARITSHNGKPQSALARLLERCGIAIPEPNEPFDESVLDGLSVLYTVKQDGHFVRIDPETVRV